MSNRNNSQLSNHSLERQFLTFLNDPYPYFSTSRRSFTQRQPVQEQNDLNELRSIIQMYQTNMESYQRNMAQMINTYCSLLIARNNTQNTNTQPSNTNTTQSSNSNTNTQTSSPPPLSRNQYYQSNHNSPPYNNNANLNQTQTSPTQSQNDLFQSLFNIPSSRLTRFQTLFLTPSTNWNNSYTPISRLSNTQIVNNTRRIVYDASFSEPRCPVSLDDFEVGESVIQIIPCGHYFKSDALMEWFRRNTHCPVCRYNLANRSSSQTNDSDTQNNVRVETVDSDDDDDNEHSNQDDGFSEQFTFEIPIAIDGSGNAYLPPLSSENRTSFESEIEQTFQTMLANALNEYLEHR